MKVSQSEEAVELFDALQRQFDVDEYMPTMSDSDLITLALVALKHITTMPYKLPISVAAAATILEFHRYQNR